MPDLSQHTDPAQPPGTDFRRSVLDVVASVPDGRVLSYGGVALMAGRPRAARGVGSVLSACGEGVPWWRVVNAAGRISARPTARLQRSLLEAEGVVFEGDRIDLDRFGWTPPRG